MLTAILSSSHKITHRVVFAGGGTGGHLFPGIAVARELLCRHPDAFVVFVGTGREVETRILSREGYVVQRVRSMGLMGKSLRDIGRALLLAPITIADSFRILGRTQPDIVIGLGGYSAGPIVLLAALRGSPTMVMEQNAVPGITNRLLARIVRSAAVSYDRTRIYFGDKAFVSGNPVRSEFFRKPSSRVNRREESSAGSRILVVGGSQGAHELNVAMVSAATRLSAENVRIQVVHQTGDGDVDEVRLGYRTAGVTARVEAFFDNMDDEMRDADIALCRAGATTLAEIAATGLPAVVVPLPRAANDHQRLNAAVLAELGAAEVVEQEALEANLTSSLLKLLNDHTRRKSISDAVRRLAKPDAARLIVDRIESLVGAVSRGEFT